MSFDIRPNKFKLEIGLILLGAILVSFVLFQTLYLSLLLGLGLGILFSVARVFFIQRKELFYTTTLLYVMLICSESIAHGMLSIPILFSYVALTVWSAYVLQIIFDLQINRKIHLPLKIFSSLGFLILFLIALYFIGFFINFRTKPDESSLYAVLQTDWREALEFINLHLSSTLIIVGFLFIGLWVFVFMRLNKVQNHLEPKKIVLKFLILSLLMLIGWKFYSSVTGTIVSTYTYFHEIHVFKKNNQQRQKNLVLKSAKSKENNDEIHVVVLGESLNKKHMGLYGYFRDTTPNLNAEEKSKNGTFIKLNNAYSHHTHTNDVLKLTLTEANNFNGKEFFSSPSIVDIAKAAGMKTYWITNQQLLGEWDSLVSVIAHSSDHLESLNQNVGRSYFVKNKDEALIPILKKSMDEKTSKSKFILVHLAGNHWNYCDKFTKDTHKFGEPLTRAKYGAFYAKETESHRIINCYDNSVVYNDLIVTKMLAELKQANTVSTFTYFSDHADDVLNGKAHESTNFTFDMTDIPYLVWVSDEYKSRYQAKVKNLQEHVNELFPNDLVYDTLVGMMDIQTVHYGPTYDLSNESYRFDDSKPSILNKHKYTSPKNVFWHQTRNGKRIHELGVNQTVLPHRMDSIGKLKEGIRDGYYSFEIDLRFTGDMLEVGHDSTSMSGESFEAYLNAIDVSQIKKIWLDMKNPNQENIQSILSILNGLDKKHHFKGKTIFESQDIGDVLKIAKQNGFHTSFYLPVQEIQELMKRSNVEQSKAFGKQLIEKINRMKVSAISFDVRIYPFVKTYIEAGIGPKVVFHVWDLSIPLYTHDFFTRIENTEYLADKRVNTVLYPYISYFEL